MKKSDIREFFHILIHPYDGFEEMNYHKTGSPILAGILILSFFLVTLLERFALSYRFNHYSVENSNVLLVFISTAALVSIAVVANWALSTLWDGKANLRTIWIVFGYALGPIVFGMLLRIACSYACTLEETAFMSMITTACTIWGGLVLWFGLLQTQEYTIAKNLACIMGTVVGIILIMFLAFLVILLFQQLGEFIYSLYDELAVRISI